MNLRYFDPTLSARLSTSRLPLEWQQAIEAGRLLLLSLFDQKQNRVTTKLATQRNRFVWAISDEILIPYAAPGSKTEALFQDLIASRKRVYTFESQSNTAMISTVRSLNFNGALLTETMRSRRVIASLVHIAHAASDQRRLDFIGPEFRARGQSHGCA